MRVVCQSFTREGLPQARTSGWSATRYRRMWHMETIMLNCVYFPVVRAFPLLGLDSHRPRHYGGWLLWHGHVSIGTLSLLPSAT